MMDNIFNSKEKRFIFFYVLFAINMIVFLYAVYLFSSLLLSIDSTQQLMILTNPNHRDLYWPVDAIGKIMDQRLNFLNILVSIVQAVPFSFYVGLFCLIYIGTVKFDKLHIFYKHQQALLISTFVVLVSQIAMILLFLYGFLGGSVASAIKRLHLSAYVGYASSIILVLLFLIMIVRLLIDFLAINEKL